MVDSTPYDATWAVLLIGLGMLLCATVAVIGMVVMGARWSYRMAWCVVATGGLLGVIRPADRLWWAALAVTTIAAVGLLGAAGNTRKLPAAAGPGERAVLVPLVLIAVPLVIGLVGSGPRWAALTVGLSGPVFALAYSKVVFGGLVGVRIVWPLLVIVVGLTAGMPWGLLPVALGACVAALAWHPSVKAAFHPPREVGSTFRIPPELAPSEILDAASIDDRGRPK